MDKAKILISMGLVGTIGIFVNYIPLPSAVIACTRAIVGSLFLLAAMAVTKTKLEKENIQKNALLLLASGTVLGLNWVFLFEAYRYTTVAVATLCYYMAPVFVMLVSPVLLKEKMTAKKVICTLGAVAGAVLISGALGGTISNPMGITFGLIAACFYCSVMILNRKIKGLTGMERTFCQLAVAAVVMSVYVFATTDIGALTFSTGTIILLLVVGVVHTGIVYLLYFPALGNLPAQTSAVLSYIDPVVAIILSAFILAQPLEIHQIIGTIFILGFTLMNEIELKNVL